MKNVLRIHREDNHELIAERVAVADRYWSRLIGLWGKRALMPDEGLLLVPCSSVHTFFMRFAIDIVAIDRCGVVLGVCAQTKAGRIIGLPRGTHAVLELPAGRATFSVGTPLRLAAAGNAVLPASTRFMQ